MVTTDASVPPLNTNSAIPDAFVILPAVLFPPPNRPLPVRVPHRGTPDTTLSKRSLAVTVMIFPLRVAEMLRTSVGLFVPVAPP